MLFGSHKFNTHICGFCNQESDEDKVDLFGFNSTSEKAAICSNCLLECISNVIANETSEGNDKIHAQCDLCGKSLPDITKIYSRSELGICENCITYLVGVIVTVGKKEGVEFF